MPLNKGYGDRGSTQARKKKPPRVTFGPQASSERERDASWDEPGRDQYANKPWSPEFDDYTGPPGFEADPMTDFDEILKNNPGRILSEKQMQENIAAAGLAREAAIKRAMLALSGQEKDIAKAAGFQQADLGSNLADRGMIQSGGLGAGTMRVEENRARGIADANQRAQDVYAQAYSTEADIVRGARQGYETYLADLAEDLAKDPRYQTPAEKAKGEKESNKGGTKTSAKKPPKKKIPRIGGRPSGPGSGPG